MPRPNLAVAFGRAGLDLASGTASEGQGLLELWQGREGQGLGVANGLATIAWAGTSFLLFVSSHFYSILLRLVFYYVVVMAL
jgi:hypothetical protein